MDRQRREDPPDWAGLNSMVGGLKSAIGRIDEVQRRSLEVTGIAWSDDRLVKAVVGPRGHLLELEIDPRVYRTPNSKALAATIVATVRAATEDALAQTEEIIAAHVPSDLRAARPGRLDMWRLSRTHDADLADALKGEED